MQVTAYKQDGTKSGNVDLPDAIFATPANPDLLSQAARIFTARGKRETAHSKVRSEVSGGGRKPWRQKGTGRARHGSIRSPIWRGGGVTFGPRRDGGSAPKLPKRMRMKALAVALSEKVRDGELAVLDGLTIEGAKTKEMASVVGNVTEHAFELSGAKRAPSVLFVVAKRDENITRASRNIPRVTEKPVLSITALDVLQSRCVIFEKNAIPVLVSRMGGKPVEKQHSEQKA